MKKYKNKRSFNKNQQSFFFEDYLSTNQKFKKERNDLINEDRIYILFFSFFFLIFSLKIIFVSFQSSNLSIIKNYKYNFNPIRNDIVDRNEVLLSKNSLHIMQP